MNWFTVHVVGTAYETYGVLAENSEDARARWFDGEIMKSEVDDCEVIKVTEAEE